MPDDTDSVSCPTCAKEVAWTFESLYRPFCSERCKLIDLGEWAAERYRIAGEREPPPDNPDSLQ